MDFARSPQDYLSYGFLAKSTTLKFVERTSSPLFVDRSEGLEVRPAATLSCDKPPALSQINTCLSSFRLERLLVEAGELNRGRSLMLPSPRANQGCSIVVDEVVDNVGAQGNPLSGANGFDRITIEVQCGYAQLFRIAAFEFHVAL
ncbi:hypothetical protein Poly41_66710 [Novipirellula artificiosorum]|uniref:Uncharacterized protein n=1 Tax=Novipirellula artificiosorum TaxID=2528016 RepID=A0A5C6D5T2_9BACT|nr:hypothetical protein Poly41_66710 [Novipirellula artificiosorum]